MAVGSAGWATPTPQPISSAHRRPKRLAALDAERPPDLDDVAAIRARLPAPWELADARKWADKIRAERGWPTPTADPAGDGDR